MLRTSCSKRNENMPGWPISGAPIKRQIGMIYWYSWGKHEFDIRVMRRVLGLPEEHAADKWFMAAKPDACRSFNSVMEQLQAALGCRNFNEAIVDHDCLLDEEAKAFQVALDTRNLETTTAPAADISAELEDAPF